MQGLLRDPGRVEELQRRRPEEGVPQTSAQVPPRQEPRARRRRSVQRYRSARSERTYTQNTRTHTHTHTHTNTHKLPLASKQVPLALTLDVLFGYWAENTKIHTHARIYTGMYTHTYTHTHTPEAASWVVFTWDPHQQLQYVQQFFPDSCRQFSNHADVLCE